MSAPSHRCEITVSTLTYRGDRDERLVEFTVTGEGASIDAAAFHALSKMAALGHLPGVEFNERTDDDGE